MYFPLFVGVLCLSLFCNALLCVHSSFAIILKRKRKLVALLLLSYRCIITKNVLWLFLRVLWVDLQCVILIILTYFLTVNNACIFNFQFWIQENPIYSIFMKHFKIIISYQYTHFGCIKKVLLRCLFYVPIINIGFKRNYRYRLLH